MSHAVRFYETGGPEVLRYEQVDVGDPGPGQVRVRHVAVGLNFADTYFRLGYYPVPVPNGMGVTEAGLTAGLVAAGVPEPAALAAALSYRVFSSYLPPVWGFFSMRWLQQHEYL